MIENMIVTSYTDKSYLIARWGGYVASIQMMSHDKLKHQVSEQYLSRDKFILSQDISLMSRSKVVQIIKCTCTVFIDNFRNISTNASI